MPSARRQRLRKTPSRGKLRPNIKLDAPRTIVTFKALDMPLSEENRKALVLGNQALRRLRAARRERVVASSYPGLVSWALDSFMQYGLHRIVALGTGMTAEWNKKRLLNCIVLSRSLMETVGALFRVLDDTYKLLPTEDIRGIHSLLTVAMFGRRDLEPGDKSLPKAVNALTGIDRLEKAYPGSRQMYDWVCEYVHPNCDGYLLFGQPNLTTADAELGEHLVFERPGAVSTATLGMHFLDWADGFVRKYETLFKNQVEALDRKFGEKVDRWPGDPGASWRPSDE